VLKTAVVRILLSNGIQHSVYLVHAVCQRTYTACVAWGVLIVGEDVGCGCVDVEVVVVVAGDGEAPHPAITLRWHPAASKTELTSSVIPSSVSVSL
jgi:hypothetical protein